MTHQAISRNALWRPRSMALLLLFLVVSCSAGESSTDASDYNNQVQNLRSDSNNNYDLEEIPRIPVDYDTSLPNDTDHNDSTPVIPVPGGDGNHTHNHSQHHTFAPTLAPTNSNSSDDNSTTIAPTMTPTNSSNHTTVAPNHTPHPTPTPAPTKAYPTPAPTVAPDDDQHQHTSAFQNFLRMMGKLVAWCLLMGLAVLAYGWAMNHRYQIAYYCRHLGHCLVSCQRLVAAKLRQRGWIGGGRGGGGDYMAVERYDAQAMNTLIFDSPHTNPFEDDTNNNNYSTDNGFVLGQHSNVNFQNMG